MEDYGATGGGKYQGVSAPLKAPTLTPAQRGAIASYAGPAPNTSVSSYASAGPAPYIAPVQDYAGPQSNPYNTGPLVQPKAAPQQAFAPAPPPPPPAPPVGGRQWYNSLGADQQAAENNKWLGGDSDYTAQVSEFDRALQTFVDRIANQKKAFDQDAADATASTGRNQTMSLDSLGEDFGARGLSYSGMFSKEKDNTNNRFNEAKGNIEKVRTRNNQDASNREADYRTENAISKDNASRASLSRQAQRQALLDSSAGF